MRGVGKVAVVDKPDKDADDGDDFCEHVAKVIELLLQRCSFRDLRDDTGMYVTDCCRSSRTRYNGFGMTNGNCRSLQLDLYG
jgi:hypothetical protein